MISLADCAVAVSDAKAAARWWRENLGFAVHMVGEGEHAVMIAPPGDRFVLHLCEGFEPVQPGNTGIAFVTDDIDGVVRRMRSAGVAFPEPLKKGSWGGMAKFADPDGNVYWLMGAPTSFLRREANRRAPLTPGPGTRDASSKRRARSPQRRR